MNSGPPEHQPEHPPESPLKGKVILVTRPAHQAAGMLQQLEQRAAKPLAFASIEISAIEPDLLLKQRFNGLHEYDWLIFVSANAVEYAALQLDRLKIQAETIKNEIAVIGRATQAVAEKAGFKVTLALKKGFNSEALLQHPAFQAAQLRGEKILIIRGVGGLAHLGDTLLLRGAKVDYAEVYRRAVPQQDVGIKRQQLSHNWSEMQINAITVTSNESLQNLYDMLGVPGREAMLKTCLIVPSRRCQQLAQALGYQEVVVAESALNEHILEALNHAMMGKG
ncbi:Uroporphyrinogen-III synthase [hydrothermal vent metagenome]|uniref:uroporphyrinogen-III synthase n=1 Tax=hydrothermal vent metagenome TaxID=652676 RepID=A0A3B0YBN4_9ZZZZ